MLKHFVLAALCSSIFPFELAHAHNLGVQYMNPGILYNKNSKPDKALSIFCYRGTPKNIFKTWQTVFMTVSLSSDDYTLYKGDTPKAVYQMYEDHKSSWIGQLFTWRSQKIHLDPFIERCIGIETANSYDVSLHVIRIDYTRILLFAFGVLLFFYAPQLSSNPLFYYICCVTLGITTSILIALYLISKVLPKKPIVYGLLVGSWSMGIYLLQSLWNNMRLVALNYQSEVLGYIFVSGIISFIVSYRSGPVTDPRSKNLIKWALQSVSLAAMFYTSAYWEISTLSILFVLMYYNFPSAWSSALRSFWRRRFPPKRKLLSEEEYYEQGERETVKALNELRKHCSSPEYPSWKTILSLREPIRFAKFVEGSPHLDDSEIMAYETEWSGLRRRLSYSSKSLKCYNKYDDGHRYDDVDDDEDEDSDNKSENSMSDD